MGLIDVLQQIDATWAMAETFPTSWRFWPGPRTCLQCRFVGAVPGWRAASNIKIGLSVMVTALLMPGLARGQTPPGDALLVVALLVKEVMIGVTIGFLAQLMMYAVQTAGALIDVQRGMDQPGLLAAACRECFRDGPVPV